MNTLMRFNLALLLNISHVNDDVLDDEHRGIFFIFWETNESKSCGDKSTLILSGFDHKPWQDFRKHTKASI